NLPEAYLISNLLEKAKNGLSIHGESKYKIIGLLQQMLEAKNLTRIIHLLSILDILAESEEMEIIAPAYAFHEPSDVNAMARLEKIFTFVLSNYKKEITFHDLASLANMSVTSFCRYFKGMTHKTFSEFLIEIRVSHVCRALVEDRLPTEVICFECGFNNISNFYRHFKKVTGMTPFEYKKKYLLGYKLRAMKNQA